MEKRDKKDLIIGALREEVALLQQRLVDIRVEATVMQDEMNETIQSLQGILTNQDKEVKRMREQIANYEEQLIDLDKS